MLISFYLGLGFGIWFFATFKKKNINYYDLICGVLFTFLWPFILFGAVGWTAHELYLKEKNENKRPYNNDRQSND
jgi:hypothetical protein